MHALNCTLRRDFVQWSWQELLGHRKLPTVPELQVLSRSTMREGIHDGTLPAMIESGAVREVLVSRHDSN